MAKAVTANKQQMPPETIIVLLGVAMILILVIFYFAFYSDLTTKRDNTIQRIAGLRQEIEQLQQQESQLVEIRKEKERLESRLNILRAKIPSTSAELNYFFDSVIQRAKSSRVSKWILFEQDGEVSHGEYASIPIRMEFESTYEAAIQFFWDLANMGDGMKNNSREQIINIKDVQISRVGGSKNDDTNTMLKVSCVAETYIYTGTAASSPDKKNSNKKNSDKKKK